MQRAESLSEFRSSFTGRIQALAQTHTMLAGRHDEALRLYDEALKRKPDLASALAGKGHTLKTVGRQADAIESYRACLEANPWHGETWWSLANLKTFRFMEDEVQSMERLLADPDIDALLRQITFGDYDRFNSLVNSSGANRLEIFPP